MGRRSRLSGVTLPELLVVIAIVALAVTVALPVIREAMLSARLRTSVNGMAMSLRATRMVAITRSQPIPVFIVADAGGGTTNENFYEYEDIHGQRRKVLMPGGVHIVSTDSPVVFLPNGSVAGGASTVIEAQLNPSALESWKIDTNIVGISSVTRTAP